MCVCVCDADRDEGCVVSFVWGVKVFERDKIFANKTNQKNREE